MKELQILSPDGKTRSVPLDGGQISVGRSATAELSFPDDSGLSRQHFAIEREGEGWAIRDLGSKNGTVLNGSRLAGRAPLKSGDKITAGHLVLIYDGLAPEPSPTVVFFDSGENENGPITSSTIVTDIGEVIGFEAAHRENQGPSATAPNRAASNHVSVLLRAGNELAGDRPLPELFRFILDLAIQAVNAGRGVLMTLEDGELVPRANKGEGFHISTAVRDRILNSGVSVLVRDTSMDEAFRERRSIVDQNVRSLMAVPLQASDRRITGIIYVDSPPLIREFTKDDLNLLTFMANIAAIRIEQKRHAEMEQARQLLARDLAQAAEIQQSLLPASAPAVRGLDLAGHNSPCRTVGGDYYDFFPYGISRVAMVLGDVSGKGMPASLLMMGLQARVQILIEEPKSLSEVMTKLNRITSANCPGNRFITLFLCILDGDTGELIFCNAGHNPPVLARAGGAWEQLSDGGPVLGILPAIEYREYRTQLDEGDTLVIYSDGVTESVNPAEDELDIEGLAEVVMKHRHESAQTILSEVNQAVAAYTENAPQADDITLIIARRPLRHI